MGVCNRCKGSGKVRGHKEKAWFNNGYYWTEENCPKCGGTGQYVNQGLRGTGSSSKTNSDGTTHHSLYRKNKGSDDHISWDTDRNGNYIPGTGHHDKDGKKVTKKNW